MLTRDEIILAAECCIAGNCGACPFINRGNCITDFMENVLECIKNEPAPAATGTSSEVSDDTCSILQFDDSTLLDICQEGLEKISEIALDDYPNGFLTGYIEAFKDNIKRLRGGDGNGQEI